MVQHEELEQITLFEWARLAQGRYPELRWLHHIPNGGHRNKATAGRLRAAGVKSGVPDVCLPVATACFHGLYIEMKYGRNRPSGAQKEWLDYLQRAGYCVAVCYGWEEAMRVILGYLGK